jgi:hypothetical protein
MTANLKSKIENLKSADSAERVGKGGQNNQVTASSEQ